MTTKNEIVSRIETQLDTAARVRARLAADPEGQEARDALRSWQANRLARTHADLLENPRYASTASFFLNDFCRPERFEPPRGGRPAHRAPYGESAPIPGLETVADAIELNALSESLDADMIATLKKRVFSLTEAEYVEAYRAVGRRPDRERQIELIAHLRRVSRQAHQEASHRRSPVDDEKTRRIWPGLPICKTSLKGAMEPSGR